ncbi:hypothetical protein GMJAKD_15280 [Candidatus Electrothrix aarhusensis]
MLHKLLVKIEKIKLFLEMISVRFLGETTVSGHREKINTARQSDEESENMDQGIFPNSFESLCSV